MNSDELVPKLVRACLDNDRRLVEEISTMLVKLYKKKQPNIAQEISQSLTYSRNGASAIRTADVQPLPIDRETRYSLQGRRTFRNRPSHIIIRDHGGTKQFHTRKDRNRETTY